MRLRSLLFVPGDRPERFAKAAACGAEAIILDLEDSVAPDSKAVARGAVAEWLARARTIPTFVGVNPLDGNAVVSDLATVLPRSPDGIVLPKAEGPASVQSLMALFGNAKVPPILPIATETPFAIFQLGASADVSAHLAGLTWGAEDLPAAIGAVTAREPDGRYTPPYELVRALALFGAHAASVAAIETVFPRLNDPDALEAYVARGRRDGFSGMMAIHPSQIRTINDGFAPTAAEIAQAQSVLDAFDASPGSGALMLDGKMIDRPHLLQAQHILGRR